MTRRLLLILRLLLLCALVQGAIFAFLLVQACAAPHEHRWEEVCIIRTYTPDPYAFPPLARLDECADCGESRTVPLED